MNFGFDIPPLSTAQRIARALIRDTATRCGMPAIDAAVAEARPGLDAGEHAALCAEVAEAIETAVVHVTWPIPPGPSVCSGMLLGNLGTTQIVEVQTTPGHWHG